MGNCVTLCKPSCCCIKQEEEVVRVAEQDGKILEFRTPICVNDILTKFSATGVLENNTTEPLSPDHELKAGRLYYLLPPLSPTVNKEPSGSSNIKRIKVLITKKQLQQLVSKQISIEDLLLSDATLPKDHRKQPKLDSIPEEE